MPKERGHSNVCVAKNAVTVGCPSRCFALDPGLVALTFGFGSIWGTNTGASSLVRMAPNGKVLATISVVSQPRFLTADPSGISGPRPG